MSRRPPKVGIGANRGSIERIFSGGVVMVEGVFVEPVVMLTIRSLMVLSGCWSTSLSNSKWCLL